MTDIQTQLWNGFTDALGRFHLERASCRAEGAVIAAYAAFVRAFCPHEADRLISDFCKRIAAVAPQKRVA